MALQTRLATSSGFSRGAQPSPQRLKPVTWHISNAELKLCATRSVKSVANNLPDLRRDLHRLIRLRDENLVADDRVNLVRDHHPRDQFQFVAVRTLLDDVLGRFLIETDVQEVFQRALV